MGTLQRGSMVKNVLKNLCCSYGWSYGAFWRFDQTNSSFLTMQDAYYEEKVGGLTKDLCPQVSMLGGGIIGRAAFTKKHQWMSSDDPNRGQDFSNSTWDMFVDDSGFGCHFPSGEKTIAVIPVEPQGVVQFGSTEKILETEEFVNQTKRRFQEIVNGGVPEIAPPSSANSQSCLPNGLFASLISPEGAYIMRGSHNSVGSTSSVYPPQSCSFSSTSQAMLLNCNQSTRQLLPNGPFGQSTGDVCHATATCSSNSTLVSFKETLTSESRTLESWNSFSTQSNAALPFVNTNQDLFDSLPDFGIPDEIFQAGDFNISQWFPSTPDQSNMTLGGPTPNGSQTTGLVPINSDEKSEVLTISGIDVDLLGNTGDWGGIVMPVINECHLNFHSCKSIQQPGMDSNCLGPRKDLFPKLGIEELLEDISGTSNAASACIEDQVSSAAKRRKTGNSIWETSSLQPVINNNIFNQMKGSMPKSEPGLWAADAYSLNSLSKVSQAKKQVEPQKPSKKKAKPGTRPRPKDRQQILDRMAELRELIPNGEKMSIDCLLDRTIKHMLFLQSVTKHADRIKQAEEPKNINGNDQSSNGVTWACELGNQTMVCPLIVEDLNAPGQMLIEMLCEEHGFFLEIVDIIRGFGLTILKGVMEVRNKIWGRFIVEAEVKRHVTRHEVFSALVQHLQTTSLNDNQVHDKVMEAGHSLLDDFQHSLVQLPVSLPETYYCVNL